MGKGSRITTKVLLEALKICVPGSQASYNAPKFLAQKVKEGVLSVTTAVKMLLELCLWYDDGDLVESDGYSNAFIWMLNPKDAEKIKKAFVAELFRKFPPKRANKWAIEVGHLVTSDELKDPVIAYIEKDKNMSLKQQQKLIAAIKDDDLEIHEFPFC